MKKEKKNREREKERGLLRSCWNILGFNDKMLTHSYNKRFIFYQNIKVK